MKKKTIKEVIDTLYLKYKCIDNEDIWVEITDKYIKIIYAISETGNQYEYYIEMSEYK